MSESDRRYILAPVLRDFREAYRTDKKGLGYLALTFVILVMLLIYSFDTFGSEGGCSLADSPQSSPIQKALYDPLMRLRSPEGTAKHVSMVTVSEEHEPLYVISNTCESRKFLTALVHEFDELESKKKIKIKGMAIDQSFSDRACLEPVINNDFRKALEMAGFPIVVGWGTHDRPQTAKDDECLMLNKLFDFNGTPSGSINPAKENVVPGLIRLNGNNLKIPLRWWVFPYKEGRADATDAAVPQESFSLRAAELASPNLIDTSKTLALDIVNNEHPYSSFVHEMPSWSAMDVLCYGPDEVARGNPDWGGCEKIDHHVFDDLDGQIVVVGFKVRSDSKTLLGVQKYGAELHADYIEALLDGRYVKTVPEWMDKGVVVLFVSLMLFFQFLAVRKLPGYQKLGDDTALWITCIIFVSLALLCFALLEWHGWFFPVFFLSCFPIAVSLVILALYQVQIIVTKRHLEKRKGVTE